MRKYLDYQDYKSSHIEWLGSIPSHWSLYRLKLIFDIKKRIAGTIGFDVLSITQKGIRVKDIETGEGQLSMDYSKYQLVEVGDFAMNHMDLLTGFVDISKHLGVTSPDYRVFTIKDEIAFEKKYYLYLLQMGYKQKLFYHLGQGSAHLGRWRLPTEEFNEIEYPVPPKEEQTKIANFLDYETAKIDTLIDMQQQLIKLLKEKRQAVISHAVTKGLNPNAPMKDSGVEWLGEVPEHWDLIPLKHCTFDHTGIQMGPFGGMLKDLDYEVTGYKVYGQENTISGDFSKGSRWISEKRYQQLENYHLHNGDIVITRKGSLGKARIIRDLKIKGIIDSDTIRIRLNNNVLNPELLSFLLHNSFYIQEQISRERRGAILSGLNSEVIGNLKIIISPIEEQRKLIRYLQSIESKYEKATRKSESAITLLEEKRRALISSVVTGKIDVRDWKPQSAPEAPPIAAAVTVAAATP